MDGVDKGYETTCKRCDTKDFGKYLDGFFINFLWHIFNPVWNSVTKFLSTTTSKITVAPKIFLIIKKLHIMLSPNVIFAHTHTHRPPFN